MAGRPYDYVALRTIYYGGSRAYNVGDPVPADNVKAHGYKVGEDVAEYGTDDANRVTAPREAPAEPPEEPLAVQQPAVPKPPAKRASKTGPGDEKD